MRSRNKVTLRNVVRDVIVQQIVQTAFGIVLHYFEGDEVYVDPQILLSKISAWAPFLSDKAVRGVAYLWLPALRFLGAILILDSWQYWLHRLMHTNKFLYRHFHSHHHRLYVPYAFGALYNHPIEGLALDTIGAGLGYLVTRMSVRESVFFFAFSTAKTVDDHCGYLLPFDPLQILFGNNARYHDIHHQSYGIKKNFSQPYFTFWDRLCGTYMDPMETPRALRLAKEGQKTKISVNEKKSDIGVNGTKGSPGVNGDAIRGQKVNGNGNGLFNGKGFVDHKDHVVLATGQGGGVKGELARRRVTIDDEEEEYNTSVFTPQEEEEIRYGQKVGMAPKVL